MNNTVGYWPEGDVYAAPEGTPLPVGGEALDDAYVPVGYLSPDDGFTEKISWQSKAAYAWKKGRKVATSRDQLAVQRSFTYLEDNDVTRDLVWGVDELDANEDGDYAGFLSAPDLDRRLVLVFQMVKGARIKRASTAGWAEIADRGDEKLSASDLGGRTLNLDIYPDDDENYWKVYNGPAGQAALGGVVTSGGPIDGGGGSGGGGGGVAQIDGLTVIPAAVSVADGATTQLVVHAHFDDGHSETVLTTTPAYTTSDATVATVSASGLVTGVNPGEAVIEADVNGFTDLCTVTVTA